MAVELYADPDHRAVVFSYDQALVSGDTITIRAENVDTADVGSRVAQNRGTFVLFYPIDFTGTDEIVVTGSEGGEDSGTVTV
jgi:hypothetical protein